MNSSVQPQIRNESAPKCSKPVRRGQKKKNPPKNTQKTPTKKLDKGILK